MPYSVKPDGSITTDSLDEALAIQQRILTRSNGRSHGAPTVVGAVVSDTPLALKLAPDVTSTNTFMDRLRQYNGKTINSNQMRVIVGADNLNAVGPKLKAHRNAFERLGKSLDQHLETIKGVDGTVQWKVRV